MGRAELDRPGQPDGRPGRAPRTHRPRLRPAAGTPRPGGRARVPRRGRLVLRLRPRCGPAALHRMVGMSIDPDALHRTVKLELDEGRATSLEEAVAIASGYVLQIDVGPEIAGSPTMQAMLLTAVNTAARAFLGGV